MIASDPAAVKTAQRRQARRLRRLSAAELAGPAAEMVAARVSALAADRFTAPAIVAGYWPAGSELDCRPALAALAAAGWTCALPVVVASERPMVFRRWSPETRLHPGRLGTLEPPAEADTLQPALLLVPLLAFDRAGHRLGQGAGCYDRTLAALRAAALTPKPARSLAVGLGFAAQELAAVAHEAHDAPLDAVITERYTLIIEGRSGPGEPVSCA
jgi:5-formyltetrahydrofolate cyclo-ligase